MDQVMVEACKQVVAAAELVEDGRIFCRYCRMSSLRAFKLIAHIGDCEVVKANQIIKEHGHV